jgi:ATP/maltotriose-dependent transcriptional regulator MalT
VRAAAGLRIATDLDTFWVTAGLAQEARHWLETILATGEGAPADRALAMVLLARFCGLQHDLAPARIWAGQAAAEAGISGDDRARGLLAVFAAMIAVWDGDLEAAVEESGRALGLLRRAGDRAGELLALSIHGLCLGFAGTTDAAVSTFESAIVLAQETGETFRQAFCLAGLGEQALVRGEPERAEELFLAALRAKAQLGDRFGVAVALDSLGRAAVASGRARRGAILLGAAGSTWDAIGMRETGNPFAIRSTPSDGIRLARTQLDKRTFRAEFRRGSLLAQEQAVAYALGDSAVLDEGRPPVAPSPLTRRETEVAELVAEGLSNPEIAERLVISTRTAQGHVENILRKLGFTSRAMIAAWVTHRRAQKEQPQPAPP